MGRTPSPSRRRRSKSRDRVERDRRLWRSRSRDRGRRRSPDRERDYERDRRRDDRRRSRTRSRSQSNEGNKIKNPLSNRPSITDADLKGKTEEEQDMLKILGFCNFDTTKNKRVEGNEEGTVHVILKRKYRQYMNRKGGFNRPLDFIA